MRPGQARPRPGQIYSPSSLSFHARNHARLTQRRASTCSHKRACTHTRRYAGPRPAAPWRRGPTRPTTRPIKPAGAGALLTRRAEGAKAKRACPTCPARPPPGAGRRHRRRAARDDRALCASRVPHTGPAHTTDRPPLPHPTPSPSQVRALSPEHARQGDGGGGHCHGLSPLSTPPPRLLRPDRALVPVVPAGSLL